MKITLTGAAGRLGSKVAQDLVSAGHTVRAIDQVVRLDLPVRIEVTNLLNREACYPLLEGADALIHFANHPNENMRDKQKLLTENLTMNTNIFQAAREQGVKSIIFSSSIQAIGAGKRTDEGMVPTLEYLPVDGDMPAKPTNIYGLSKQLSEEMLRFYSREAGISCTAIRFPLLVESQHEIWRFRQGKNTKQINEGWSYLTVGDASELIGAILNASLEGFRIYSPAAPNNRSRSTVTELLEQHYQDIPLKRPLSNEDSLFDISRITKETGWQPKEILNFD
jgi:nucleoside-diphosphate-sugar epimerase